MEIHVRFGPGLSQATGVPKLTVSLPSGATVRDLLAHLSDNYPSHALGLESALPVVRGAYVAEAHELVSGEEVALLRPVAGGSLDHGAEIRSTMEARHGGNDKDGA